MARFERGSVRVERAAQGSLPPALRTALRRSPPPPGFWAEPPPRPLGPTVSRAELGDEAEALAPILDRWAELIAPVAVHELPGGGFALRFPALPEDLDPGGRTRFQPVPGPLLASPHRAVWEALGFRADPDRVLRTVPTPATLVARAEAHGVPLAFRPRLLPLDRDVVPAERWVRLLAQGVVPIHVPGSSMWSRGLDRALVGPLRSVDLARSALASRLAALPHDLGKHVLIPRRVPASWLAELEAGLPRRAPASVWAGWVALLEDDLPRACERMFARCEEPAHFDRRVEELPRPVPARAW